MALASALATGFYGLAGLTALVVYEIEKAHYRLTDKYGARKPQTPQGTDGHTTSASNGEDGGTKTPDPVVSGGGHDYAGLAIPVRGPITARTRLGIGCAIRDYSAVAADFKEVREAVKYAARKVARRRRPMHNTRSWSKIRKRLQFDPMGVVDEFRADIQRARRAAGVIRDVQNLAHQGNMHMEL